MLPGASSCLLREETGAVTRRENGKDDLKNNSPAENAPAESRVGAAADPIAPRGTRRIHFVSDPSSIATNVLPDPVEADDLRRWMDMLADSGVDSFQQDVYNKGCTAYWSSDEFQYDPRRQHRRFLPMLEAGIQPVQVLLDHCRRRGMMFVAGFRMNDTHGRDHFPERADFVESNPQWQLQDDRRGLGYNQGFPLDFTFEEVRDFVFRVMREVVDRFDVDGIEMTFRDPVYFPFPEGRERAHLMTALVSRLRDMLDAYGETRGRRIQLGARVFSTLEECLDMGLDVPAWIAAGLLDYVSPMDTMFCDFNAPWEEFGALTRQSGCMLYPTLNQWTSHRMRMSGGGMSPSNCRALAHTFYGAGADGLTVYAPVAGFMRSPPFFPQTLQVLRELRDPDRVARGDRHYIFDPTWEGLQEFGRDYCSTGVVKAHRVLLERSASKPSGRYPFRLYEGVCGHHRATLLLRGSLTARDELEVSLNGTSLAPGPLGRPNPRFLEMVPEVRWFPLPPAAMVRGENQLTITLVRADPREKGDLVLDELQVWVQPE